MTLGGSVGPFLAVLEQGQRAQPKKLTLRTYPQKGTHQVVQVGQTHNTLFL